jgi:hypothetical protein
MIRLLAALERMTCVAVLLVLAGCSAEPPARTLSLVDVQGTVTRNGEPLPRTMVMFIPVAEGGSRAKGFTDQRGRYRLIHESDAPGIERGEYKVIFQQLSARATFADSGGSGKMAYGDPTTTPFHAHVSPDAATFDFDLSRPDGT